MDTDQLRSRIHDDMPRVIDELSRLVAIPSIGYEGYDPANVRASAELTRDILREAGVGADLLEIEGGHPAVFGTVPGPADRPTVLLYAHHDVQPAADPDDWTSPPFTPTLADGRLFGRGAADDKSGIVIHAAALRAVRADGPLPCSVKVIVEGEEECSTQHLPELVRGHGDLLRSDVAVIADGGNYRTGVPTIGTSIRGATHVTVRVDVLPIAQHSGAFGGPLPDAVMALSRMLASLHDDDGEITIGGLLAFPWPGTQVPEDEFRAESRVFPEIELLGTGTIADRTLSKPAINVLAFEAPRVNEVANQIVPTARAVVGLRMAPGEDYAAAVDKLAGAPACGGAVGRPRPDRHGRARRRIHRRPHDPGLPERHLRARDRVRSQGGGDGFGGIDPARADAGGDVPGDRGADLGGRGSSFELPFDR